MTTKVKQEVSNRNTEYKALHKTGLIRSHRKQTVTKYRNRTRTESAEYKKTTGNKESKK